MRASRTTAGAAALGAAAAVLGLYAGGVIGGEPDAGPGPPPAPAGSKPASLEAERAASPIAKRGNSSQILYLESQMQTVEAGPGGHIIESCPKGSRAVNG